jgi:drug/metabolite transporter (DMT)-like permease
MRWILVAINIISGAASDLLNTAGMRVHGEVTDFKPKGILRFIHALFLNRFVLAGVAAMILSFFALISLLSIAPVSFAIPATAGSFLVETLLAKLILKEDVHWKRWAGATIVGLGVALLAYP